MHVIYIWTYQHIFSLSLLLRFLFSLKNFHSCSSGKTCIYNSTLATHSVLPCWISLVRLMRVIYIDVLTYSLEHHTQDIEIRAYIITRTKRQTSKSFTVWSNLFCFTNARDPKGGKGRGLLREWCCTYDDVGGQGKWSSGKQRCPHCCSSQSNLSWCQYHSTGSDLLCTPMLMCCCKVLILTLRSRRDLSQFR